MIKNEITFKSLANKPYFIFFLDKKLFYLDSSFSKEKNC